MFAMVLPVMGMEHAMWLEMHQTVHAMLDMLAPTARLVIIKQHK